MVSLVIIGGFLAHCVYTIILELSYQQGKKTLFGNVSNSKKSTPMPHFRVNFRENASLK
jgi:hypothetical protein